ncbi:MAG: glycoside hydrolase family 2 protein, partial [Clostridia bacterium]|nr:glycoside hydrolase family 2 protein [Clostridia bacterium]
MELLLNGKWNFAEVGKQEVYEGNVPGDVMSDLMDNGVIPDPRIGLNEQVVQWVGEKDWEYSRTFEVNESMLQFDYVELDFDMLDTLADIYVNDIKISSVKNINRHYSFDVKSLLRVGENTVCVRFFSPLSYIAEKHKKNPLPNSTLGEAGSCHIRKSPYHFGWDWGPHLLTCGISGECRIKCYNVCKITRVDIKQTHVDGKVTLDLNTGFSVETDGITADYALYLNGEKVCSAKGSPNASLTVEKPVLWWCNNMGGQTLYDLKISVYTKDNELIEEKTQKIGLRTIELKTDEDEIGKDFCFYINGKRIFARGANWIPADSFINNVSDEKLYDLLYKAKACNMNMIRVWGGGYYESDRFYDICDRLGLLVWQDCNFACSPYPFNDEEFVQEVLAEIDDNVLRLKNRACLCLWAGNNEIESMSMAWLHRQDVIKFCGEFFYNTLKERVNSLDGVTAYWACTPSSGTYMKKINSPDYGDTHLWHVWHGLRKLEHYRKMNTRFCSEFGIESLPSLNAIEKFSDGHEYNGVNAPLAKAHQKCIGGNNKIKYYMLSKFWTPENFMDTVYLSQLTQAICVKNATEGWRVKKGRCNGALYWQYNDCWGVNSWSGMDYYGNMKALQYIARRFNQNTALSIQLNDKTADIFFVNDYI